jgi:predicted  nucleic acid-binding Zn ribbon protein
MYYFETQARRGDGVKRLFFGSSVKKFNIEQCPRCRGTDKAHELQEGFAIAQFRCERCDKEWWS